MRMWKVWVRLERIHGSGKREKNNQGSSWLTQVHLKIGHQTNVCKWVCFCVCLLAMFVCLLRLRCQSQSPVVQLMFQLWRKDLRQGIDFLHPLLTLLGFVWYVVLVVIPSCGWSKLALTMPSFSHYAICPPLCLSAPQSSCLWHLPRLSDLHSQSTCGL